MASPPRGAAEPASLSASTCGAAQPAIAAPQLESEQPADLVVGSFNFGMPQTMFQGKNVQRHVKNFQRVCETLVDLGDLDLLFCSEVGDSLQGFKAASLYAQDILAEVFRAETFKVDEQKSYMSMWGFTGALLRPGLSLEETELFHVTDEKK